MIGHLVVSDGAKFDVMAPGGFRILSALDCAAETLGIIIRVTSGTDGCHSGQADPHHRGDAYDFGSHEFTETTKQRILDEAMEILNFEHFYGFLESPGTANEHFHFQVKKGTVYPPVG